MVTKFSSDNVPEAPKDPLFGVMVACRNDASDTKIDLSIGAYRDNQEKVWVLPVVKKVALLPIYFITVSSTAEHTSRPLHPLLWILSTIMNISQSLDCSDSLRLRKGSASDMTV